MAHILLIEPDRKLAATYAQALMVHGHSVVVGTTAQKGILAADDRKPDVVVLELQLVAHSGIEFLYEFRSYADWQAIPVIICTNVMPGEFAASEQLLNRLGVRAYHYKPRTSLKMLVESIEEIWQTTDEPA